MQFEIFYLVLCIVAIFLLLNDICQPLQLKSQAIWVQFELQYWRDFNCNSEFKCINPTAVLYSYTVGILMYVVVTMCNQTALESLYHPMISCQRGRERERESTQKVQGQINNCRVPKEENSGQCYNHSYYNQNNVQIFKWNGAYLHPLTSNTKSNNMYPSSPPPLLGPPPSPLTTQKVASSIIQNHQVRLVYSTTLVTQKRAPCISHICIYIYIFHYIYHITIYSMLYATHYIYTIF